MSKYLSTKLKFISFALILLIVLLHSQMIEISSGITLYIQEFFDLGFTRVGVPMFFMISGFLFFQNKPENIKYQFWVNKIKSRIKTLFVPYVLWTLIGIIFVKITLSISLFNSYFENIRINNNLIYNFFHSFIIPYKVVYQLWFVRDLFFLVLISPIIYILVKKVSIIYFIFLEIFYTFYLPVPQISSVLSFSIGVYIALFYKKQLDKAYVDRRSIFLFLLWLLLCIVLVFLKKNIPQMCFEYIQQFVIYIGIISSWVLYDYMYKYIPIKVFKSPVLSMSFWIFLTHEPVLTIIKKVMLKYIGNGNGSILITYVLSPVLTVMFVLFVGNIIKKYFKSIYSILVGGRI